MSLNGAQDGLATLLRGGEAPPKLPVLVDDRGELAARAVSPLDAELRRRRLAGARARARPAVWAELSVRVSPPDLSAVRTARPSACPVAAADRAGDLPRFPGSRSVALGRSPRTGAGGGAPFASRIGGARQLELQHRRRAPPARPCGMGKPPRPPAVDRSRDGPEPLAAPELPPGPRGAARVGMALARAARGGRGRGVVHCSAHTAGLLAPAALGGHL